MNFRKDERIFGIDVESVVWLKLTDLSDPPATTRPLHDDLMPKDIKHLRRNLRLALIKDIAT